jgi:DNA-binding MarR family transcriptional regulator
MPGIVLCMLSKSALEVLSFIERKGPISPRDISIETDLPIRTVFYAINNLVEEKLVFWKPSLADMRQKMYSIDTNRVEQLREIVEPLLAHNVFHIDRGLLEILGIQEIDVKKGQRSVASTNILAS